MRILQGDTVAGQRELEQALEAIGGHPGVNAPGRQYGELLARQPERRAQGIRILRWHAVHHAVNTGRSFLELGRALEAEGDRMGARDAYQHVLRLLHHADPYRRADWEEARAALMRIALETPR